jgi:hypothetical protein
MTVEGLVIETTRPTGIAGRFVLLRPLNGAVCPDCGYIKPTAWVYIADAKPHEHVAVACEDCRLGLDKQADGT